MKKETDIDSKVKVIKKDVKIPGSISEHEADPIQEMINSALKNTLTQALKSIKIPPSEFQRLSHDGTHIFETLLTSKQVRILMTWIF